MLCISKSFTSRDMADNVVEDGGCLPSYKVSLFLPHRHVWDKSLVSSRMVATVDTQTDVFHYVTRSTPPHSDRDHCLLRAWHRDVPTGNYVIVSSSVSHPQAELRAGVRTVHLASHYLLQPCPHGTLATVMCREDWR